MPQSLPGSRSLRNPHSSFTAISPSCRVETKEMDKWAGCVNEPPLEDGFGDTPPASGSGVGPPSGHGPNVLNEDEIKHLCKKWNNQRQRAIFLEFQDAESMGNVKDEKTIAETVVALTMGEASPEFITVGYISRHSIQMAIKIKSTGSPISIGEIMENCTSSSITTGGESCSIETSRAPIWTWHGRSSVQRKI